jgi:HSP20 family protein
MVWDPFEEMKRMQAEMERSFKSFMKTPLIEELKRKQKELTQIRQPLSDIVETDSKIAISVEMPGVSEKDIVLKVTENSVEVKAEKKEEMHEKKKGYYRHERSYKGFHRYFTLPSAIETKKVETELKNGILKIILKKKKFKKVKVRV